MTLTPGYVCSKRAMVFLIRSSKVGDSQKVQKVMVALGSTPLITASGLGPGVGVTMTGTVCCTIWVWLTITVCTTGG